MSSRRGCGIFLYGRIGETNAVFPSSAAQRKGSDMFWLYEDELPPGVGVERFGAAHLAYIVFFLGFTVCFALFFKKRDEAGRRRAERVLGSAVLFFGLCEYGVTALAGRLGLYSLPLHLCSLLFFLVPLHAWIGGARSGSFGARLRAFLGAILFFPGLPGVWAALLFPDWLNYPFWNYLSISGFMGHGLVSAYAASVIVRRSEAAEQKALFRRDLKSSTLFVLVGAAAMYVFDRITGANYWFMNAPSADSPLAPVYERGGFGAYLLVFLLAAAAGAALCFGLRYLFSVRGKKDAAS